MCRRRCYQKAMAGMILHTGNASREGCVCRRVLCVVCFAPVWRPESSPCSVGLVQGHPGDSLPLRLLVQLGCCTMGQKFGERCSAAPCPAV